MVGAVYVGAALMLSNATVSVLSVTSTDDGLGNETSEYVESVLEWALVAPRSSSERSDSRVPGVVVAASVYGPFGVDVGAEDLIVIADHSPTFDGEWQVDGLPGQWSIGGWRPGFEVAVKRVP